MKQITMRSIVPAIAATLLAIIVCAAFATATPQQALAAQSLKAGSTTNTSGVAAQALNPNTKAAAIITVQPRVKGKGWLSSVRGGRIAGITGGTATLSEMKIAFSTLKNVTGHIKYRTYDWKLGWGKVAYDGAASGRPGRAVKAVRIGLTGAVSEQFDVKYRVYLKGIGWQPWKKNYNIAGIASAKGPAITAIQVNIVMKGVDSKKKQLNGIDIASYQEGLNPKKVNADFIIVKATEGTWYTNPYFEKWANATLQSGKLLGLYHFIKAGSAKRPQDNYGFYREQADFFVEKAKPYLGKCILFLDWEDSYESNILDERPGAAKVFLDRVYKRTGVKPLIYTSKSVCRNYDWKHVAAKYGLWVAQYAYKYQDNGTGYLKSPWTDANGYGAWKAPTLFQYTSMGKIKGFERNLDLDLFYGSAADWKKLQKKS